jgi:hypothetical protein
MFLFFIRHFNDVDHLAPVAWRMNRSNHPVAVYCMNPRYDPEGDYRLNFLKEIGVTVEDLYRCFDRHRGRLHGWLASAMRTFFACRRSLDSAVRTGAPARRISAYLAGQFATLFYKLLRRGYYDRRWAKRFLAESGARAVCFDHVMPGLYVVRSLLKAAAEMGIPSFSLPHGVHLYTNEAAKPKATGARRAAKFNAFDHIIVPNALRRDVLVESGVSPGKISVLGSARYCAEWLARNEKILPRQITPAKAAGDRLKVVFLPSKPQCRVDLARLKTTCETLAGMADADVMVKPHTRAGGEKYLFTGNRLTDASHILTAELCDWADVALVVGSSVITEPLMRKKPVLYLKYLHANTTLFEELGACWKIEDENELEKALTSLKKDRTRTPYTADAVAQYIEEVVYGGTAEEDVLGNYETFITGHAAK